MKVNIQSTKDVALDGIKCVVYGAAGVGKTRLALTVPDPIILSAENGLLSLRDDNMPFIEIRTIEELEAAYKFCKSTDEYKTVFIDSISEISENILAEYKKEDKDGRQSYGKMATSVGAMLRNFRRMAGKHVVMIAKERRVEDEESGVVTFEPYIPGKVLPFNLPFLVDELFNMQIDRKGTPFLQVKADRKRPCKDRSGALEDKETPDLGGIISKIESTVNQNSQNVKE